MSNLRSPTKVLSIIQMQNRMSTRDTRYEIPALVTYYLPRHWQGDSKVVGRFAQIMELRMVEEQVLAVDLTRYFLSVSS